MKASPIINRNVLALLVLALGTMWVVWLFSPKFYFGVCFGVARYFFSGQVLTDKTIITGGALDQPSLHKYLFLSCLSIAAAAPPLGLARWLMREPPRGIRVTFRALSAPLFLLPAVLLTSVFFSFLRYVAAMGFTPRRIGGMLFTLTCLAVVGVTLRWTWSFRRKQTNTASL